MKLLITGGAGFIGSHLLHYLAGQKHEIVVLDNLSSGKRENVPQGMRLVEADIRSDLDSLFATEKFATVIHLAAQTMVPYSIAHPMEDCDVNLLGMINILECCRKYGVKNFIFSSTAAVYGDNPNIPLKESERLKPASFYGISKMAGEYYMCTYHNLCGMNTTVLRFSNVYGERQSNGGEAGVIAVFCELLAEGKPVTILGNGMQTRDFIYVGDVVRAIAESMKLTGHNIINVSTGKETSIEDVLAAFEEAMGRKAKIIHAPRREADIFRSVLDNTLCKKILSYRPQMEIAEGIKRTYEYQLEKK